MEIMKQSLLQIEKIIFLKFKSADWCARPFLVLTVRNLLPFLALVAKKAILTSVYQLADLSHQIMSTTCSPHYNTIQDSWGCERKGWGECWCKKRFDKAQYCLMGKWRSKLWDYSCGKWNDRYEKQQLQCRKKRKKTRDWLWKKWIFRGAAWTDATSA